MAKKNNPLDMKVKDTMLDAVKGGASIADATKAAMKMAKPKKPQMGPTMGKAKPGPKNAKGMKAPTAIDKISDPRDMLDKDNGERNEDNEV